MIGRVAFIVAFSVVCHGAVAQGCSRSLDYILNDSAADLPRPAASYQNLYKECVQTLTLTNVRDAFVLQDGGIAVLPRRSGVFETAQTLSEFCRTFPQSRVRFVTRREMRRQSSIGLIVLLSSSSATSCKDLRGQP